MNSRLNARLPSRADESRRESVLSFEHSVSLMTLKENSAECTLDVQRLPENGIGSLPFNQAFWIGTITGKFLEFQKLHGPIDSLSLVETMSSSTELPPVSSIVSSFYR